MSRNKHGRRSGRDTRDFGDPKRVQALLEQLAEEPGATGTGKKKNSDTPRGKPAEEKVKSKHTRDKVETNPPKQESKSPPEQVSPKVETKAPKAPEIPEASRMPETSKAKLETPTPKPAPKIKRELAEDKKLAYVITGGPILSQIHYAFDGAGDNTGDRLTFALEERIYRSKGKPKIERQSVCRIRVLNFGYDASAEPKRWQHLVITGEIDILSQHLPEVPYYPDGTPFIPGAKIKLFYNLEARCGFIIKVATTNEFFSPYAPEGMGYVAPDNF